MCKWTLGALVCALTLGCGVPEPAERAGAAGKADDTDRAEAGGVPVLLFEDADLQCFDGRVEIGLYGPQMTESELYFDLTDTAYRPGNTIKIRVVGGRTHVIDKSVFGVTDGFGNDTYQVMEVTPYGLREVTNLHYDHEEGWLRGYYALPQYTMTQTADGPRELIEGFGPRVDLPGHAMECYAHTFGSQ